MRGRRNTLRLLGGTLVLAPLAGCLGGDDDEGGDDNDTDDNDTDDYGDDDDDYGDDGDDDYGDYDEDDADYVVTVGPDGLNEFSPYSLEIDAGSKVLFEWDSDFHNVNPTSVPDDSNWEGEQDTKDEGHTHWHEFTVEGTYEYQCDPHEGAGMTGTIVVGEADDDDGDGYDHTVTVGPDGNNEFYPETLEIDPYETVEFVWESNNHNVNPTSVPDDSDWEGEQDTEDEGHTYSYEFTVEGTYEYQCDPHAGAGMLGTIVVGDGGDNDTGGDGDDDGYGDDSGGGYGY